MNARLRSGGDTQQLAAACSNYQAAASNPYLSLFNNLNLETAELDHLLMNFSRYLNEDEVRKINHSNLENVIDRKNKGRPVSAASAHGGASNKGAISQLSGKPSRRPGSSLSRAGLKSRISSVHRQSYNNMILSQLLDPILIKLWNLVSPAQSSTKN